MDTNSKKATAFVLEKLNSAGIEVITDKEEFDRILENEKILQKMTADLSEFENLSSQLTERKQEANELEYKKNKIIENKEKQKSEDFKNLNEKILNYEKYLPDDAVINLSRKNEVKNNTPEQTYQLIKSNGIMLYQTTSVNGEENNIYDILFKEEIAPKKFKSFYSNTDFSTLKNEIEDIIKDFLKDQIEKQKAKTEQLKNFIEHSKEFNNEEQHNDNILINLSNLEGTLNRSLVHPRDIFREALRANAAAIIVFHNHPSGTLYPSQEDINTTERLMRASRNIGIPLLDHLIVTKDNYRSLSDVMESIERKLDNEKNNEFLVQDGKTYGFVHEGKIYLDPEVMDSNVAVHEYTHLWDKYIQNTNPELWEKGKAVFKNTSLWKQVTSDPAYSDISGNDDLVLSECHARICGNLAKNVLEKIAREDGEITKDRIIDWDKETWEYLAQEFSADMSEFIQVKDFINLPVKDLMASKKISHKRTNTKTINKLTGEYPFSWHIYTGDLTSHLKKLSHMKKTSEQIDEYISKGILPENSRFILPPTPDYLLQTGARNTDVTIAASVIKKALNIHGLSPMQIKNAIYKLYDPVIVFDTDRTKSENKAESRLILTDEWKDGKPVAIAVNVNSSVQFMKDGHRIFLEVQDIRSIHDRELIAKNGTDLIQKWTKDGLCRYVDDKKISDWSTVNKVYFPIEALQPDSKNIILKSNIVNTPSISSSGKNNKISFKKPDNNQEDNMSSQEENITKFSRNINADDESKTGLSDDGIIRKRPEQFEEADRDNIKQTTLNYVVQKLEKAGIEVIADKEEFLRILNREAFLQKSVKNLSAGEAKEYFTFDREDAERFNKILDDWENKKKNPFLLIQVGKIPPVMKALGIADKLIEIESATIAKVLRPEPVYPNDKQGHNLTMDDVRAVPDLLADPIMVFKSRRREDSYVFFTERRDFKDRSIIIPIAVNKRKGRIIINEITSMYGRNNEIDYVYSNAEGGYLVYMDEKRTKEWEKKTSPAGSRAFREQYSGERATKLTGLDLSILTKERLVKFISSRQLMVSDGKTYGFVHEGKIYLNPEVMDSNVAVHEYTHLWDKYIQNTNPELWEKGKAVFKNTSLWKQVTSDPAYSDISGNDDLVLSECHARICGNLAKNVLEKIAREDGEITKDRIIDWDKETWEYLAKEFSEDMSELIQVKDFINLPIKDLMNGNKIQEFKMKNTYQETTTNYLLDKLSKSGIEVSTDQKEFLDVLNYSREINSVKEMIDACSDSETPKNLTEENKIKYLNNLNLLRDKIEASSMTPEEFLTDIRKACGIDSTLKSKYLYQRIDNNSFAIRISDYNTNEIGSVNDGKNPKIIIKLVSDTTNTNLEEIEYDSEISKDKMKGIISGLQDWLTKGVYTDYDYDHVHITPKDKIMQDISEEMTIGGLKKTIMTGVAAATMFCSIPNVAAQTEIIKQELLSSGTREMATREMGVLKVIQSETIKKEKITIKSTLEYVEFTDGSSVISNIDNKDGQLNISVILDNDGHPIGVAQYDSYKNFLEQKIQNGEAKKTILDNITTCIDGEKYKEFFENWTEIADSVTRNGGLYKIDNFQSSKDCVDLLNTWTLNNRNANVFQYFIEDSLTYGITYKNKIYLNPDLINANVIAHEYTHLWDKYIQNANPELWERGKAIFSKTCLWNEVKEDPAYLNISKNDDLVLSECHARICGKMAEEILNRIALENGGEIKEDVINWDKEVEKYIESEFGILRPDLSEDMSHLKETLEYEELKSFLSSPLKDIMSEKRIIQNEENISVPTVETEKETFVVIRESEGKFSVLVSKPYNGKFIFENTDGYPNAELLDKIQAEKITEELKLSEKNDVTYTVMGKSEFLEKFRKSSHEIITDEPGNKNQFKEEHNSQMLIEGETVLPKFSVITQNGLVTFEGAVLEKRNANEKSWTIRDPNGETMTIQDSTIYEIMDNAASVKNAPEENKENIKNGRNFEYLIKSQYKDFYELRPNTANNFIHNYEAYCRREANSPCDGLLIAKKIIEKMPSGEKNKIESLLKKRSINNGITVNEMLIERYHKAVSIVPINTREVREIMDKEAVSYPYKEFKFHKGEKLSEDRDLIRNNRDFNLKIGDTISLSVAENKVFGKGKELISFDSLKVISASKDCNVITLMDSKKSLLELPLDSVLAEHKRQAHKEITRQQNKNTIKNAISR